MAYSGIKPSIGYKLLGGAKAVDISNLGGETHCNSRTNTHQACEQTVNLLVYMTGCLLTQAGGELLKRRMYIGKARVFALWAELINMSLL